LPKSSQRLERDLDQFAECAVLLWCGVIGCHAISSINTVLFVFIGARYRTPGGGDEETVVAPSLRSLR
jgi:hypothetical protein